MAGTNYESRNSPNILPGVEVTVTDSSNPPEIRQKTSNEAGNFYIEKGELSDEEIIRSVKNGFFVTELIGSGVSVVTGDYSRGAAGQWIENGELVYPVSEVTIAGNLRDMLMRIEAIGSDLEFRGSIASPTLLIGEMTVSGQ